MFDANLLQLYFSEGRRRIFFYLAPCLLKTSVNPPTLSQIQGFEIILVPVLGPIW